MRGKKEQKMHAWSRLVLGKKTVHIKMSLNLVPNGDPFHFREELVSDFLPGHRKNVKRRQLAAWQNLVRLIPMKHYWQDTRKSDSLSLICVLEPKSVT